MTSCAKALVLLCLLAGCQGTTQVFDNPVVGPPPPRISQPGIAVAAQSDDSGSAKLADDDDTRLLSLTSFTAADPQSVPATGLPGEVAARVNGNPIFVTEVLQPYAGPLEQFRSQASPEEFLRMQRNLIARDLPHYIETAVLVDAVLIKMDAEQKAAVEKQLDTIFEQQLGEMMRLTGAQSVAELQAMLKSKGTSLSAEMQVTGETVPEIRKSWGHRALSAQFLRESLGTIAQPTRPELLEEYHKRVKEYSQPAKVKWQQLQVSYAVHNGQDNARLALARARADLQAGMSFDEVVAKHGDGPLAKLGGHWDWMQPDSIADAALKEALQTLKKGEVSGPIECEKSYMLVRITDSQAARTASFEEEEIQNELRKAVSDRKKAERMATVVAEIKSKAIVETMFDGDAETGDRQETPDAAGNPQVAE
ncbi:MAG: peptidyl-prolyl cis-trans isomerase [Planctomycetaceae bacterium]|nr:peptidyl-prolyl cis-trans isomerase [Planctomycetaceae bacterium]